MRQKDMMMEAFQMRIDGYTYEAIAEFLKVTRSYAKRLVTTAIENERSA